LWTVGKTLIGKDVPVAQERVVHRLRHCNGVERENERVGQREGSIPPTGSRKSGNREQKKGGPRLVKKSQDRYDRHTGPRELH